MTKMKCPGQDTRFWTPDDICEAPCKFCGAAVEFFKDDVRRNCPGCGRRIVNPRVQLGCAEWCEHADECLGAEAPEVSQTPTETSRRASKPSSSHKASKGS
ncbi:hypothetical protein HQ560_16910 [bacterium]|nr:hypothetical protein [bacterium]